MGSHPLLEVVYDGDSFSDSSHLEGLYASFQQKSGECVQGGCEEAPILQATHLERIHKMKECFVWTPVPSACFSRFSKSSELSSALRERATKWSFSNEPENLEKALRGYNLALAFAPPNSLECSLALEKRAELLLQLLEPNLAHEDIQATSRIASYPQQYRQKLISLQARVTSASLTKQRQRCLEEIEEDGRCHGGRKRVRKFVLANLYTLQSNNPHVSGMADGVDIDYQPQCGRRVIVTKEVKPGEVVMLDEPYSLVLERLLKWDVEHCTHCSKPVLSGIPCSECTFGWYCSHECEERSNRHGGSHHYEHRYLSYLKCNPLMSLKVLLAARILFSVGPEELFRIFKTQDPLYVDTPEEMDPKDRGYTREGHYTAASYLPILHLVSHTVDIAKAHANAFKALLMTHLVESSSNFFSRYTAYDEYGAFKDFFASLLLRHMESIEYNAITLSQLSPCGMKTIRYGAAVYPTLCLINHSCDPNCVPVRSITHLRTSVIAMRTLQPGEEVTFSYAPHFSNSEYEERRSFLHSKYNFWCRCDACLSGWGPSSKSFYIPESQCNRCGRYVLQGQCPQCILKDSSVRQEVLKWPLKLEEALDESHLCSLKYDAEFLLNAFEVIKAGLNFCSYGCLPSNHPLSMELQDSFKKLLVRLVSV